MKKISLYILLWFILASCEKLPPETAKGRDIVACKVNGEIFKSKEKKFFLGASFGASATIMDTVIYIKGSRYHRNENNEMIFIVLYDFRGVGSYFLGGVTINSASYSGENIYNTHYPSTGGTLIVKKFDNKIIAGTFEFTGQNTDGIIGDITEGRFDIEYKPF